MTSRKRWCSYQGDKPVKCSTKKSNALKAAKRAATSGHSGLVLGRVCDRNGRRCSVLVVGKSGRLRWKKDVAGLPQEAVAGIDENFAGIDENVEAISGTSKEHLAQATEYDAEAWRDMTLGYNPTRADAATLAEERWLNADDHNTFWRARQQRRGRS